MGQITDKDYLFKGDTNVGVLKTIQKNRDDYDGDLVTDLNEFVPYLVSNTDTFKSFEYVVNVMGADIMFQPKYQKSALINMIEYGGTNNIEYFEVIKKYLIDNLNNVKDYFSNKLEKLESEWLFSDSFADWLSKQDELKELEDYLFKRTNDARFAPQSIKDVFIF